MLRGKSPARSNQIKSGWIKIALNKMAPKLAGKSRRGIYKLQYVSVADFRLTSPGAARRGFRELTILRGERLTIPAPGTA